MNTVMREEVRNHLLDLLQSTLGIGRDQALEAGNLFDLGLDSYGFIQLISGLEERFAVRFETDELMSPGFKNVPGIVEALISRKSR